MLVYKGENIYTIDITKSTFYVDSDGDLRINNVNNNEDYQWLKFGNKKKAEEALFLFLDNRHKAETNYFVFDLSTTELTVVMK